MEQAAADQVGSINTVIACSESMEENLFYSRFFIRLTVPITSHVDSLLQYILTMKAINSIF